MQANHILSIFALSSLVVLTGCSDKSPVENTTEVATPEAVVAIESAVTEPTAIDEPIAEAETVKVAEVIDDNPPRFADVTDYFALKPDANWSWNSLADTSGIENWDSKVPAKNEYLPEDPSYSIRAGLDNYGGMAIYGSKRQPELITIGSGQAIMEDETGSAVYKLEDLFRESEITRVKSNCDTHENDLFSQRFYRWQKPGYQPLYVYAIRDNANAGTSSSVGIAKSFDKFFDSDYDNVLSDIRARDLDFNDVTCTFDL